MYWSREYSLSDRPFTINSDYYNSNGIAKPTVNISDPFIVGGVSGVMVTINPFAYNPKRKQIRNYMIKLLLKLKLDQVRNQHRSKITSI